MSKQKKKGAGHVKIRYNNWYGKIMIQEILVSAFHILLFNFGDGWLRGTEFL